MNSLTYLCTRCGVLRRSPVLSTQRGGTLCAAAVQHCGKPMKPLTHGQGVAATHAEMDQRVQWAVQGLHILRRGGKRKWVPALTARQTQQAQQQYAGYLARREEAVRRAVKALQLRRSQRRSQPADDTIRWPKRQYL